MLLCVCVYVCVSECITSDKIWQSKQKTRSNHFLLIRSMQLVLPSLHLSWQIREIYECIVWVFLCFDSLTFGVTIPNKTDTKAEIGISKWVSWRFSTDYQYECYLHLHSRYTFLWCSINLLFENIISILISYRI